MEPGSLYLEHLRTLSGTGQDIAHSIHSFFTKNQFEMNNLVILCTLVLQQTLAGKVK